MASWRRRAVLALAAVLYASGTVRSFLIPSAPLSGQSQLMQEQQTRATYGRTMRQWVTPRYAEAEQQEVGSLQEELDKLKSFKIKDIKLELDERGVSYGDLLEKSEFMQRLADARVKGITKPKEEPKPAEPQQASSSTSSSSSSSSEAKAEEPKKPAPSDEELYEKALADVMKLRVSEMKKELDLLKVDHRGFFEKGEFAQALARARVANRGADDEDPSEYRTVEVKRMPKAEQQEDAGGARGGGNPFGGADPFSGPFGQAGGARGGPGGFSSIFDAMQNGGFGGMGGMGGMGGAGGGPVDIAKIMNNPRAMAAFQRAQQNPRIMKALQEMASDPSTISRYASDPEISSVLKELQGFMRR